MEPYETYYYDAKIEVIESRVKVLELERECMRAELRSLPGFILSICFFVAWTVYSVDFSGDVIGWKDNSLIISLILLGLFFFFLLHETKGVHASSNRLDLANAKKHLDCAEESYKQATEHYREIKRSLRE